MNPHNTSLCSYEHYQDEILQSYVCVSLQCDDENRLCCFKCLIEHHHPHLNNYIHVNSANQFLMNSIIILEDCIDIKSEQNDNYQQFQLFFTKKLNKLKRAIIKVHNIQSLLQYIEDVVFAYNIRNLMKQFISGCHQIIEKQFFFSKIDEIFTMNQKLYLDELQVNAEMLKSQFYYEECIQCCENYLNLQEESEILLLKGQCQHMMNELDEAEKTLTKVQHNNFKNKKSQSSMILLIESQQEMIFNNLQIDFTIIDQNLINLLIGKQMIIQKKYQQALQILVAQLDEDYLSYFAITYKGLCLFYLGQYGESQECCNQASQIYPKYYAVLFLKYLLLIRQNQVDEARKIIQQNFNSQDQALIKSNQFNYFQNENNYPQLSQIINQQIQQTNGQIQQIQQIQNNYLEKLYNQGLEYQKNLKYDEAIEIFQEGISLDEQNEKFWKQKIITQFLQQQISEVEISIQIYLSMNPQSREILNVRNQFKFFQYFNLTLEPNLKINEINTKTQDLEELYEEGFKCLQGKFYSKALEIFSFVCSKNPNFEEAQLKKCLKKFKIQPTLSQF